MTASFAPARPAIIERRVSVRGPVVDERTYRRRRAVVGAIAAVVVTLTGVALQDVLAGPGGVPASAARAQPAPETRLVAHAGDTMWAIAERHHGDVAFDRYLDALVARNGGASLQAGQVVVLP